MQKEIDSGRKAATMVSSRGETGGHQSSARIAERRYQSSGDSPTRFPSAPVMFAIDTPRVGASIVVAPRHPLAQANGVSVEPSGGKEGLGDPRPVVFGSHRGRLHDQSRPAPIGVPNQTLHLNSGPCGPERMRLLRQLLGRHRASRIRPFGVR